MSEVIAVANNEAAIRVPHVIQGRTQIGSAVVHHSRDLGGAFTTAELNLNELVWSRLEPGPAFDMPVAQIIEFLIETGRHLNLKDNRYLQEAADAAVKVSPLGRRIVENTYNDLAFIFSREALEAEMSVIGADVLDGWQLTQRGGPHRVRAFPPRMLHIPAGNSPVVSALTIARGALCKGVHLIKLPSNDLFSATAILRTMADIDPQHPVTRSFSAAYWRGGDERVESNLYRAQYFDKVVAWGGEASMRHIQKYIGPGLELISFDPKTSFSLVGREAFASDENLRDAARRAAEDVKVFNQDACVCSRFQFVEGSVEEVDRFCALQLAALGEDSHYGDGVGPVPPKEVREEIDMLGMLEPVYRVFGTFDGRGVIVRSDEPVGFHPIGKVINVVPVQSLADGVARANVATQTVGVYPPSRKAELRNALAGAGVQRIVPLGGAQEGGMGHPHDAFYPLQRFVRWVSDEGED
jgi:hypothetical protein